jgi:hypothetical protein
MDILLVTYWGKKHTEKSQLEEVFFSLLSVTQTLIKQIRTLQYSFYSTLESPIREGGYD